MSHGDPSLMRDYAFYEASARSRRARWIVGPLRRLLRRLLGPVWAREYELFTALDDDIRVLRHDLAALRDEQDATAKATADYLTARLDALERQVHAAAAAGWDQTALARRLIALEERLDGIENRPQSTSNRTG
jgi:hypothetical protein